MRKEKLNNNERTEMMKKILFENYDNKTKEFIETELDLNTEPTINDFIQRAQLQHYITQVGVITKDEILNPGYRVLVTNHFKRHKQWVYILVIDGKVVKCGESTGTLNFRWGSYGAGTRVNRENGTCSTTNYFISEIVRKALELNMKIELYGHPIDNIGISVDLFGSKRNVISNNVKIYESKLINLFMNIFGHKPIVGKNGVGK